MRAILGLVDGDVPNQLESFHSDFNSFQIDEEFTYLDGASVLHGEAATLTSERYEGPAIDEDDGTIFESEHQYEKWVGTEWFADLENAGFMAVDSGDGEFAFWMARRQTGANIVKPYLKLDDWVSHLEDLNASFEWLGWSDPNEAGVYYPDSADVDSNVKRRAMTHRKSHIGFDYNCDVGYVRGAAAASGYVEAYNLDSPETMTRWLRDEILPFAEVPENPLKSLLGGSEEEDEEAELPDGQSTLDESDDGGGS